MSNQKVSQQLFLSVKQKLDNYKLSTNFPIEVTPLLYKLTQLIDGSNSKHSHYQLGGSGQGLSAALRHEMSRILKQNNKLHMDLMTARQEIQSLNHRLYKFDANKHIQAKESSQLSSLKEQREVELVEQLRQVKFKYNQLMDFIHQDPQNERQYIKRLMKHKHQKADKHHAQEFKQTNNRNQHHKDDNHSSQRIRQLQTKGKNRQAEILRLQNLVEYDGMNMNKIIKNFQDSLSKSRLKDADHKINFLQQSIDKIKKENTNMKNKNGSKQALRAQVQKSHSIINKLKEENQQLRRNHKQQNFDVQKHREEQQRKVQKVKSQKEQVQKQTERKKEHINELQKKISFLQKQCKQLREQLEQGNRRLSAEQQNLAGQHKKNEQLKVFYQYQIQTYKKKIQQLQFETHQLKITNQKLLHQYDVTRRESDVKSASIINLQKIVNQLMKKNSILSDNKVGFNEQSIRINDSFQAKRQLVDLQQQLIHSHNQREQLQADRNALQHRFGILVKDNERLKIDFSHLRGQIAHKDALFSKIASDFQEAKTILKKTQHENSKISSQFNELLFQKDAIQSSFKKQNEKLVVSQRNLITQIKQLQIKISEEQGVLEIVKIKLAERQERLKHVERLLNESVQQSRKLSSQLSELDQKNHEISREKHRVAKKYQQLKKQSQDFKNSSFKNYQQAINDNLNEVNALKKQIVRLNQSEERHTIRYEQVSNLLNLVRRQKQLQQVDKISLCRQVEHLQIRVNQLQQIQRALVIQNENLRNIARRS